MLDSCINGIGLFGYHYLILSSVSWLILSLLVGNELLPLGYLFHLGINFHNFSPLNVVVYKLPTGSHRINPTCLKVLDNPSVVQRRGRNRT